MPNDAKTFLAIERATGVPRSQLRRIVREQQRVEAREIRRETVAINKAVESGKVKLGPSNQASGFHPNPITPQGVGGGNANPPAQPAGDAKEVAIDDNGTINLYTIPATFIGPAV